MHYNYCKFTTLNLLGFILPWGWVWLALSMWRLIFDSALPLCSLFIFHCCLVSRLILTNNTHSLTTTVGVHTQYERFTNELIDMNTVHVYNVVCKVLLQRKAFYHIHVHVYQVLIALMQLTLAPLVYFPAKIINDTSLCTTPLASTNVPSQ